MKDIDFDELDRAVSSLMGTVPKDDTTKNADANKEDTGVYGEETSVETTVEVEETEVAADSANDATSITLDEEPVIVQNPDLGKTEETKESYTAPTPRVVAPPSRGRFMDMVRPTREMRNSPTFTSRQGTTLQPSASMGTPEDTTLSQPAEAPVSTTMGIGFDTQAATMPGFEEDTSSLSTKAASEVKMDSSQETDDSTPLSSPFLPDAKVEKRPLGRAADTTPPTDSDTTPYDVTGQTAEESSPSSEEMATLADTDLQRPQPPLPAELDSKLLNIEKEDDAPVRNTTPAAAVASEVASVPAPESIDITVAAPAENVAPTVSETSRSLAAAAIPQQYKLEARTNEDVPASAIYDTQPIAHPMGSKPGWVWVLAIVGILVLGAAGGAAVYYLGLL